MLRVGEDGSLTPVPGGPVWSGGVEPFSIAVHDHLVYVANAGNRGVGNCTGFELTEAGQLVAIPGSTVALPATAGPGDVLFNHDGRKLVGTRVASSQIDSFTVGHDRRLTAAPGSPFPAQGLGPFGSAFRPTNPNQLFVSNAHNGAGVSAFNDTPNGTLNAIGASPFAISRRLRRAGWRVNSAGSVGGTDAGVAPAGDNLYINETAAHGVAEFSVDGGQLSELSGSPVSLPATITASAGITAN